MKEFKKIVGRKEEIDFSLEETNGHFVYVLSRGNNDHIPGNFKL